MTVADIPRSVTLHLTALNECLTDRRIDCSVSHSADGVFDKHNDKVCNDCRNERGNHPPQEFFERFFFEILENEHRECVERERDEPLNRHNRSVVAEFVYDRTCRRSDLRRSVFEHVFEDVLDVEPPSNRACKRKSNRKDYAPRLFVERLCKEPTKKRGAHCHDDVNRGCSDRFTDNAEKVVGDIIAFFKRIFGENLTYLKIVNRSDGDKNRKHDDEKAN